MPHPQIDQNSGSGGNKSVTGSPPIILSLALSSSSDQHGPGPFMRPWGAPGGSDFITGLRLARLIGMASGENELIRRLAAKLATDSRYVSIGIGDDMAALRLDHSLVTVTADMLLDGVHFEWGQHPPEDIGRKAIACSLSDCAAMACDPRGATVSIALPRGTERDAIESLFDGMHRCASFFDCPIVGGDTTSWAGPLVIDVAILAEPMARRGPVLRSTAVANDTIFVTGELGGSLAGRHLEFWPRLDVARAIAREESLHAMMDISDGLAMDLHRLCEASGCDAELEPDLLEAVIHPDAREAAAIDGRSALEHALHDGEDFELIVIGERDLPRLAHDVETFYPVGRIIPRRREGRSQLWLTAPNGEPRPLPPGGFEHPL